MIEAVFNSFQQLFDNFTWKRLAFLLLLIFVGGVGVWLWEYNTGQMRLARIEKTVTILGSMSELQERKTIESDPALSSTLTSLKNELKFFTERKSDIPSLSPTWWKALTGAAPWLLLCLASVSAFSTKKKDDLNGFIGCLLLAAIFGGIGVSLPDLPYLWMNYVGFPIVSLVIVFTLAMSWRARQNSKSVSSSTEPAP